VILMRISLQNPRWGRTTVLRQSSFFSGSFDNVQYIINPLEYSTADFILLDNPATLPRTLTGSAKRVFISMENPDIWHPPEQLYGQIDIFISFYLPPINHLANNIKFIQYAPCVPWFYGIQMSTSSGLLHNPLSCTSDLDHLANLQPPQKSKLISMVTSTKTSTQGHQWRLNVAHSLKEYFRDDIDIFGFGHNPLSAKEQAIDPYMYSIVIENSSYPHYHTEKIVDALLGYSIPIYSGNQTISAYTGSPVPTIPFGIDPDLVPVIVQSYISEYQYQLPWIKFVRSQAIKSLNLLTALPSLLQPYL